MTYFSTTLRWTLGSALLLALSACGDAERPDQAANRSGVPTSGPAGGSKGTAATPKSVLAALKQPAVAEAHRQAGRAAVDGMPGVPVERVAAAPQVAIEARFDPDRRRLSGRVDLAFINHTGERLDELIFALGPNVAELAPKAAPGKRHMTIGGVWVNGSEVEPRGAEPSLLRVPVQVADGEHATVRVTFGADVPSLRPPAWTGKLEDASALFELVSGGGEGFGAFGHRGGVFNLARFYPIWVPPVVASTLGASATAADVGRFATSHHTLTLRAPSDTVVVSSGTTRSTRPDPSDRGLVIHDIVAPATREVALSASSKYVRKSERVGDVLVTSFHLPDSPTTGAQILQYARRALELYERDLGPYPYRELSLAQAPLTGSAGGIAFPGLIVISDIFYDRDKAAGAGTRSEPVLNLLTNHPALRETLEFIVAHEVAHQWFGIVLGTDRVRDAWVDEGLAGAAGVHYFKQVHGDKAARRQRELQLKVPYQLSRTLGGADHPVATPPERLGSIYELGGILYGKAGLFWDTLRRRVSNDAFFAGIRDIMSAHGFQSLDGRLLVDRLVASAPRPDDARRLAARWLEQRKGDEDIGSLAPDVLLEYLVADAAMDTGTRELLSLLTDNAQFDAIMGALFDGGELDMPKLVDVVGDMVGLEPGARKWAKRLMSLADQKPSQWGATVNGLLDEVGADLGLEKKERDILRGVTNLLFEALDDAPTPASP